jgi:glycosyltransferase involved in cell wall biosynthesis
VAWDQASWLQRRINPWLERRVLRRAAAVIATTKSFLDLLPQAQLPRHRFHVTNGFDPRDFPTRQPASASAPDIVTIIYTGMWRPGYGPNDLYAAVQLLHARGSAALARLRIVTAGFSPGRARAYGIEAYVEERGRIPHAQATEMMCSANAVYLPVSQGVYEYASMPGKLFEYLGSGRPVLASALAESEVARTLTQVGGALRIEPGDIASLASALERLCAGANDIFSARNTGELAMYTRANLTGKLASVLDTVARQRHGD